MCCSDEASAGRRSRPEYNTIHYTTLLYTTIIYCTLYTTHYTLYTIHYERRAAQPARAAGAWPLGRHAAPTLIQYNVARGGIAK